MTDRIVATPIDQNLTPYEFAWTSDDGTETVETVLARTAVPFGQVMAYWLNVNDLDKAGQQAAKFNFLRAALPTDEMSKFAGLVDTVLTETNVDEFIQLLLTRYETPPPRPSTPPKPSRNGRRTTASGSPAKRTSAASKKSTASRAGRR